MKNQEEVQIESVQYVYDKEFAEKWKEYYFSLVKNELNLLLEECWQHEENGDLCS